VADKPAWNNGQYFLTLVFASIFLVSIGVVSHNAFAMGQNGCINEYDGPFTSFTINNGSKTFDALENQGMTFNSFGSFNVTFVIHTPNVNSGNNSNSGATWFGDDFYGYENGHCVGPVGPNQNVTVSETLSKTHTYGGYVQSVTFGTRASSGATFNVQWLSSPSVPQNLQATASNSLVTLSWSAPVDNGGSKITNYNVYRGTSSGTETLFATIGNVTSYNDGTVTNGQTYFYKVTAVNSVGESSPSNEASATPSSGAGVTVKSVDQNNNAIYGLYTLLCSQGTSGSPDGGNSCETGSSRLASGNTTVTFSGLPAGQTFGVDVYNNATCSFNHWSDNTANTYKFRLFTATNPPSILTPVYSCGTTVPQPPTGLAATVVSSSQINLSWTTPSSNGGSAITGYDVDRSTNNGNSWSTVTSNTGSTTTAYNDTGLSPSTTYTYRVSAINSAGTGSPSNISSATTGTVTTNGIKLDNVQSTSGSTSTSNPIMLADFNVGTGNNRLLVVGVSADNSNVGSITFGGVSLTKKVSSFHNNDAEFWYLVNPTGTGAIVVTMKGTTSAIVGAYSFSGVNQTSPLPTSIANYNSAASSPTVSITAKFANDFILDLPSIYGGVTLGASTGTQQWNTHMPGSITGASSSAMVQSPGSVTCKWTASSGDLWDDVALEVGASK